MQQWISQIEENGFCIIPQHYAQSDVREALEKVKSWYHSSQNATSEHVPFLNKNQPMVYNLQNKDIFFLKLLFGSPEIERILVHFLNDTWFKQIPATEPNYILRSYMARSSNSALPLHIDSFVPYIGNYVFSIQIALILEDQNEANGSTLFVPGSHKSGEYVEQSAIKDAISSQSKAGDVVIWDSRIWHGATENESTGTRWAIIATFARWWLKQFFNIPQSLPQEIYEQLTDNQKAILGFCSIPHQDEAHGIDMKQGYDSLQPHVSSYRA